MRIQENNDYQPSFWAWQWHQKVEGKEVEAAGSDKSPVKGEKKQDKGNVEKEVREAFLLQI